MGLASNLLHTLAHGFHRSTRSRACSKQRIFTILLPVSLRTCTALEAMCRGEVAKAVPGLPGIIAGTIRTCKDVILVIQLLVGARPERFVESADGSLQLIICQGVASHGHGLVLESWARSMEARACAMETWASFMAAFFFSINSKAPAYLLAHDTAGCLGT